MHTHSLFQPSFAIWGSESVSLFNPISHWFLESLPNMFEKPDSYCQSEYLSHASGEGPLWLLPTPFPIATTSADTWSASKIFYSCTASCTFLFFPGPILFTSFLAIGMAQDQGLGIKCKCKLQMCPTSNTRVLPHMVFYSLLPLTEQGPPSEQLHVKMMGPHNGRGLVPKFLFRELLAK